MTCGFSRVIGAGHDGKPPWVSRDSYERVLWQCRQHGGSDGSGLSATGAAGGTDTSRSISFGGGVPGGGVPVRYQRFSTTFGGIFGEGRCVFGLSDDFLFLSMKVMTLIVRKNDSAHQDPSGLRIK